PGSSSLARICWRKCMLDVECWLFWGTMMPVRIRTGSLKLYRRRASRFYGTAPFLEQSTPDQIAVRLHHRVQLTKVVCHQAGRTTRPRAGYCQCLVDLRLSGHSKSGFVRGEPGDRSGSKVERLASSASCLTFAWETP